MEIMEYSFGEKKSEFTGRQRNLMTKTIWKIIMLFKMEVSTMLICI